MGTLKHSRQRDSILAYLEASKEHPTADTIYTAIRREFPNISLGTVYRNLAQLESLGRIQKITVEDQPDRFDGTVTPHYHFVCHSCGCVEDVPMESMNEIDDLAQKSFPGRIDGHVCFFYGECTDCEQKESEKQHQCS